MNGADIVALSTPVTQFNLQSQVGVAMLSKVMDTNEQLGQGFTQMMERSVTPNIGGNIDYRV